MGSRKRPFGVPAPRRRRPKQATSQAQFFSQEDIELAQAVCAVVKDLVCQDLTLKRPNLFNVLRKFIKDSVQAFEEVASAEYMLRNCKRTARCEVEEETPYGMDLVWGVVMAEIEKADKREKARLYSAHKAARLRERKKLEANLISNLIVMNYGNFYFQAEIEWEHKRQKMEQWELRKKAALLLEMELKRQGAMIGPDRLKMPGYTVKMSPSPRSDDSDWAVTSRPTPKSKAYSSDLATSPVYTTVSVAPNLVYPVVLAQGRGRGRGRPRGGRTPTVRSVLDACMGAMPSQVQSELHPNVSLLAPGQSKRVQPQFDFPDQKSMWDEKYIIKDSLPPRPLRGRGSRGSRGGGVRAPVLTKRDKNLQLITAAWDADAEEQHQQHLMTKSIESSTESASQESNNHITDTINEVVTRVNGMSELNGIMRRKRTRMVEGKDGKGILTNAHGSRREDSEEPSTSTGIKRTKMELITIDSESENEEDVSPTLGPNNPICSSIPPNKKWIKPENNSSASSSDILILELAKMTTKKKLITKGREEEDDDDEVFTTPNEIPPVRARNLSVPIPQQRKEEEKTPHRPSFGFTHGRVSLDALPKEIMEKSIPLTRWVLRFVRGGTDKSIFPHFQFKILGFRPESEEQEWTTSAIQKVVPPYIMFTSSSIYRLDGQMDVDQATDIGFPRAFIQDFLLGFPDDWDERLELFFNKTFGPPPPPKIVEVMSDGGTVDDEKKNKKKELGATPRNRGDGQNNRPNGPNFDFDDFEPLNNRKRKEPTPSSASSGEGSDEEEKWRREARQVEKEMRREAKAAELRAKAKEEKKKRFEVKVNTTPDGVAISRSGRTLRKPMAKWAGENVTYDVHGNVVDITGVTTTTKMTVGKTNEQQAEKLAAHFGIDSPLNSTMQKERALAPPTACLPKTPAPKKSKADYKGYSDDETDGIPYKDYVKLLAAEDMATPAFNLKKGKRRCRVVESSDSEAEAEERRKEEKRRKREERRRLRESEEEEESSDNGWRRKKKSKGKKKVTVKKEKQVKRAPSKKRKAKESEEEEEEEGMGSDLEIEHDPDAVSFVLSDEGSNVERGNGYSDNEEIQSEEEEEETSKKKNQKKTVKRAKVWKKEELTRLKLAIQAANPSGTPEGWENVAKSLGGERTAEECKKSAIERLKMKFNEPTMVESDGEYGSERAWSGAESGEASEDEEKKNRRNARLDEGNAVKGISAKPGTMAHAQEMEAMKRERLLGGRQSQDDFFKNTKTRMSGVAALPSVAVFDPDDSLLEALDDDDVAPAPKQRTTKTAKMAAAPATPRLAALSSLDDSPSGSAMISARRSSAKFVPSPVVNQNDLTRYVHQLSRTKNMSMLSKSAIDQSRMMPPPLARGRMVARAAEAIDKGVSKVEKMKNGRRRDQMGDLDEDDENHDDILTGI
ncbi:hypothetical protein PRIPAC_72958 [Pristionchus pacificus]|uniref:Myb-like domain-containing protein n=1 Tax=Pristionchus pacificus TaxID=54126 RepID=A0A2A6D0Q4_PRIPA|nr:hypothetical protein PRIPAC_72958 [Pristionchus pacificus]|eukprot:PDM83863.1 hypothetical protein PRIPAC_30350 [Pristionchus pacificus]